MYQQMICWQCNNKLVSVDKVLLTARFTFLDVHAMGAYLLVSYRNMIKAPWDPPFLRFANAIAVKHTTYDFFKSLMSQVMKLQCDFWTLNLIYSLIYIFQVNYFYTCYWHTDFTCMITPIMTSLRRTPIYMFS